MSYDLMVFDVAAAPPDRDGFVEWFEQQAEWGEDHSYDDPAVCTPALRAWFMEMIQKFPPLNGPHAGEDDDNPRLTDYSVGKTAIYIAFRWSEAEQAFHATKDLAQKHGVGFFDVSSSEASVWGPGENGTYVCLHQE